MIRADKQEAALWALAGVLFQSRALACNQDDPELLEEALDFAEYLPMLIASPDDATDVFRYMLEGLVRKHPCFQLALDRFDAPTPRAQWWQ